MVAIARGVTGAHAPPPDTTAKTWAPHACARARAPAQLLDASSAGVRNMLLGEGTRIQLLPAS